jgi:hypothetical protein
MSSIDKDPKSKVSKPSDKKFLLGFKDGLVPAENWLIARIVGKKIRGGK